MQPPVAHPSRQNSFAGVVSSLSPETPKHILKNDMEKVILIQSDSRGQKCVSLCVAITISGCQSVSRLASGVSSLVCRSSFHSWGGSFT